MRETEIKRENENSYSLQRVSPLATHRPGAESAKAQGDGDGAVCCIAIKYLLRALISFT